MLGDYIENDIINIEEDDGKKYIHFMGYGYCAYDGSETPYRFLEYCFLIAPLKEVIDIGIFNYESEYGCEVKQYIGDYDENGLIDVYEHYDNGNMPITINIDDINEITPCGCYIISSPAKS